HGQVGGGDKTFAGVAAVAKLEAGPLGEVASTCVNRAGGVGCLYAIPRDNLEPALCVGPVRAGAVRAFLLGLGRREAHVLEAKWLDDSTANEVGPGASRRCADRVAGRLKHGCLIVEMRAEWKIELHLTDPADDLFLRPWRAV